jgi:membrane protein
MTLHNWITITLLLLLAGSWLYMRNSKQLWLVGGLVCCVAGDAFLANLHGAAGLLAGIGAFGCAHLAFQGFAWKKFHSLNRPVLVCSGCAYGAYLIFLAEKHLPVAVWIGTLIYAILSVTTLALAAEGRRHGVSGSAFFTGILFLLISDTFISFRTFLHWNFFNSWIIPLYLQSLLCITFVGVYKKLPEEKNEN